MNEAFLLGVSETPRAGGIPEMKEDLANIGKVPDTPRPFNGWETQKFKNEFDKAGIEIQTYINTVLIPSIVAGRIPFNPSTGIPASDIQAAVEIVQKQIADAVAGTIPNGSVTVEKLSTALLKRVFGGVPIVSLNAPTSFDNVKRGYPIGQEWISPRFEITNLDTREWTATNGTASVEGDRTTFTGDSSLASMTAQQTISNLGPGDEMFVCFDLASIGAEITGVTVTLNNGSPVELGTGKHSLPAAAGDGGTLTVQFSAAWPTASLASSAVIIDNLAVVDTSGVTRAYPDVVGKPDWGEYIQSISPFKHHVSNFSGLVQVADGRWSQEVFEILPAARGGTGVAEYKAGQILYANEDGSLSALDKPRGDSYLKISGSTPKWIGAEDIAKDLGFYRVMTGTYRGNGEARSIELPVKPAFLFIHSERGGTNNPFSSVHGADILDNPFFLPSGSAKLEKATVGAPFEVHNAICKAALYDKSLVFSIPDTGGSQGMYTFLGNWPGINYTWTALY